MQRCTFMSAYGGQTAHERSVVFKTARDAPEIWISNCRDKEKKRVEACKKGKTYTMEEIVCILSITAS